MSLMTLLTNKYVAIYCSKELVDISCYTYDIHNERDVSIVNVSKIFTFLSKNIFEKKWFTVSFAS